MHGRIMCMQALMPHYLVIGTQRGKVWLYDTQTYTFMHSSADLQDSVLCMKHVVGYVIFLLLMYTIKSSLTCKAVTHISLEALLRDTAKQY